MLTAIATTGLDRDAENALWRKAVRAHEREGAWNIASRDDSEITAERVIIRNNLPHTMVVYEVQAKALREPKHRELTRWDRQDEPFKAAILAWVEYCEAHNFIYMQPSSSDWLFADGQMTLCNGAGALAIYDIEQGTISLPDEDEDDEWGTQP